MSHINASLPVTGTIPPDSSGSMVILSQRLDGYDTFLTGFLELDDGVLTPVHIVTMDDVTLLRPAQGAVLPWLAETWSGTLHLRHGQRPRTVPADLADAARTHGRDLNSLDSAELRYALTFLGEATTAAIRRARIDAVISALPLTRASS